MFSITAPGQARSRYDTIHLYFIEILHVDYRTAAAEAANLEHTLSDTSLLAMEYAVAENDDWGKLAEAVPA